VTDAQSHSSTYVYDPFGNMVQVTDAASNVTTYSYGARGRKITSNDPVGAITSQTNRGFKSHEELDA
jgi:YD repeat-containing protein